MRRELKRWVLDTSALLCLKQDEPGADVVEKILKQGGARGEVYVCFMSLMEYCYILQKAESESRARHGYLELRQLPLKVLESDEELALSAARMKAFTPLSVADAWIAAAAHRLDAVLVHKDPEFEPLKEQITLLKLPYTSTSNS